MFHLGTRIYGADPDLLVAKATRAEELGFESLWRGDHLLLPARVADRYPHSASGAPPFEPSAPVLEVITVLAYLAQATKRIRLVTGVLVLPLREPVAVARAMQTLDTLSGGRAALGVGAGWLAEEFGFTGADFASRGERLDEAIALLRTLWREPLVSFHGRYTTIDAARFEPKPPQLGGPPIIGGGESPVALRRAATLCDGWYGHRPSAADAAHRVQALLAIRRRAGVPEPFEITVRVPADISRDDLARLEQAGVDRAVAEIGSFDEAYGTEDLVAMERFAERHL
jgi:probable F420-dependent oxidoreductase